MAGPPGSRAATTGPRTKGRSISSRPSPRRAASCSETQAVEGKANEFTAIPVLLERLAEGGGLKGALVSIDAIAANPAIAAAIRAAGAGYLLAVKANQPAVRAKTESVFVNAGPAGLDSIAGHPKGHGRIEERTVSAAREADWLAPAIGASPAGRGCPPPLRDAHLHLAGAAHAARAAEAVRGHWGIENRHHWVLDDGFEDDLSRLGKGHRARNLAAVRHFGIDLIRWATDKRSIKLRRKIAGWDPNYLATLLNSPPR